MINVLISAVVSIALIFGSLNIPAKYLNIDYLLGNDNLGALTYTTLSGTETVSNFPTLWNATFASLDSEVFELSEWFATTSARQIVTLNGLTTASSLTSIGTIATFLAGNATTTSFFASVASTSKLFVINGTTTTWNVDTLFTTGTKALFGIGSTSPSVLWGASIGTTTVIQTAQIANSIGSSTTNCNGLCTINWQTGTTQSLLLTGNSTLVVNSTSSQPLDGGKYLLKLCQDGTGSRTLAFISPQSLRWSTGTTTVSSTANSCTFLGMLYDSRYSVYSVIGSSTNVQMR